jgi:hypothetical protein
MGSNIVKIADVDIVRDEGVKNQAWQQRRRAARLFAAASETRAIETAARVLRDLDDLLSLIDARQAPSTGTEEAWLPFIRAQVAVATWQLDLLERQLTTST